MNGRIESFIQKVLVGFNDRTLQVITNALIDKNYKIGIDDFDTEFKPPLNITPSKNAIEFLQDYTFDNMKNMKDDMAKNLRGELTRALMNRENSAQIAARVEKVMDAGKVRAMAVARTESHRAYNAGSYQAAVQSGLKLRKYVFNKNPESKICKYLVQQEPIALDAKWTFEGKEYFNAPFHVNCRSRVLYVQVDEKGVMLKSHRLIWENYQKQLLAEV